MAGPVRVTCPVCREAFDVPTEVVGVDVLRNQVLCRMDRSGLYGHLQRCAAAHPIPDDAATSHSTELAQAAGDESQRVPSGVLVGRVEQFLRGGFFMAKGGSRACTMCGITGTMCMTMLTGVGKSDGRTVRATCCPACGEGNTHPAPGEAQGSCAAWAVEHGAES